MLIRSSIGWSLVEGKYRHFTFNMGRDKDISLEKKESVLALHKAFTNEGKLRKRRPSNKSIVQKTASAAKVSVSSVILEVMSGL